MSQQDGAQSSTKQRRSRKTNTAHQENGKQVPAVKRPAIDDTEAWKAYWEAQGQPRRFDPEIDEERQKFLSERRSIKPDIEQGIYPFKDIEPKLTRADVEWLLATHENGRGPVDWHDESKWVRVGLDLRGADLCEVDLTNLPLTRMIGGIFGRELPAATKEQCDMAAVHMKRARLVGTHLEGARLRFAHLENAHLRFTHLDVTHLRGAYLIEADLREAEMLRVRLEDAVLSDEKRIGPRLADAHLEGANLAVVNWKQVEVLGDEQVAGQEKDSEGKIKDKQTRLAEYKEAVRAYRQLSVVLHNQGLNEDAARFAYRAQLMQRKGFWYQGFRSFGQYLFSLFLDLLTGYGYKPIRSFITYAVVISVFAFIYFLLGPHLAWNEAIVISMTAFHGRGFFPDQFHPGDPQALVAAIEAFVGLLIEVTFIATLTQRLFGK